MIQSILITAVLCMALVGLPTLLSFVLSSRLSRSEDMQRARRRLQERAWTEQVLIEEGNTQHWYTYLPTSDPYMRDHVCQN